MFNLPRNPILAERTLLPFSQLLLARERCATFINDTHKIMSDLQLQFNKILLESENLDVAGLKKLIANLMNSVEFYKRGMLTNFAPKGMYRARLHNWKFGNKDNDGSIFRFTNENEFWNPPPKNCSLGRCNDKNESILYCTNDAETALLEIKPSKGYISLSVFKPKGTRGSRAMFIGEKSLSKVDSIKHLFENNTQDPLLEELDSYLDKLFYSEVSDNAKHLYKVSAAVTQNLMTNLVDNTGKENTMQALLYSSVAKNHQSFNFVLRPNHAIHLYKLLRVQTLQILENSHASIKVKLVRIGQPISSRNHPLDNPKLKWIDISNGEIWNIKKPDHENNNI